MYEFKLPDIGEGLHEAELLEWDVKVGDTVDEGQSIAQISTDKVNVELPSPRAGVIADLPWKPGDVIAVGEVLARIDDGSQEPSESGDERLGTTTSEAVVNSSKPERKRVMAAPAVRRYAAEKDVGLSLVQGSGPGGAITKEDIDDFLAGGHEPEEREGVTRIKLAGPRLAAAKRLEESWRTLATTAMSFEVPADRVLEQIRSDSGRITPLAVIASCLCRALKDHPGFNAVVDEKARALDIHSAINLGIAVDSSDGLLVPVLNDAGEKTIAELAVEIAGLADKARSGELAVSDFQGSTFTVSSTGSLEEATILATTPVVNFPNVATLWVSRIRERPRVTDGVLEAGPMMNCTLAFDHRFLHGADATRLINTLCEIFLT
jgi:pyruvate dehydrogenase E2 component (dihydrolipoamide acetyltransferase)